MENQWYWKDQITLPNLITTLRLLAIPWMAGEIYESGGSSKLSAILFLAIWLTDVLDGWIARTFNQVSSLGKIYDPIVDKAFQITTAVMMTVVGKVPLWVPFVIVFKDLFILLGGLVFLKKNIVVSAKWYGKLTTVLIAVAFATVFFLPQDKAYLSSYIFIPVGISVILTLLLYARDVWVLYKSGALKAQASPQSKDVWNGTN